MRMLTVLLLLLPAVVSADPGAATRYLMNEPASLMDVGILRITRAIERSKSFENSFEDNAFYSFSVFYDFPNDHIRIEFKARAHGLEKAESGCSTVITRASFMLGAPSIYFRHEGYDTKAKPHDFNIQISQRTIFVCEIDNWGSTKTLLTVTSDVTGKNRSVSTNR